MFKLAIIGGTGLSEWTATSTINHLTHPPRSSAYGEASAGVKEFTIGSTRCFFLPRHGHPHTVPPHKINYRANLWALKEFEPDALIAINAVGGISPHLGPSSLLCPNQVIDYTWGREQTFYDGTSEDLDHIEFDHPYDASTRDWVLEIAHKSNIEIEKCGTYGATQGPRLETVAEIKRLANDGCDVVGMTGMPECALAREIGIPYASICVVVNWAAGLTTDPITLESIKATLDQCMIQVKALLSALCHAPKSPTSHQSP